MHALVNHESKTSNPEEKYFGLFVKRFLVNENGLGMWEKTVMETLP